MLPKQQNNLTSVLVFSCWLWTSKCQPGYYLIRIKSSVYIYFVIKVKLIDQHSSEFMCLRVIIRIGTLKHLTNTLKIVKNEYIFEVASLKSSTLLGKLKLLHSFFSRDLAEVYVTAYNSLKFITHRNNCFCIFAME